MHELVRWELQFVHIV